MTPALAPSKKATSQLSECLACLTETTNRPDENFPSGRRDPSSFVSVFCLVGRAQASAAQQPDRNGLRCGTKPAKKEAEPLKDLKDRAQAIRCSNIRLASKESASDFSFGMRTCTASEVTSNSAPIQTSLVPIAALCQARGKPSKASTSRALVKE